MPPTTRPDVRALPGVAVERMPRHIAIIMDGNGRWAVQQHRPRIAGHERGALTVRAITEECARLGLEQLTLYCLSSENWKRPQSELDFLMVLLERYLINERDRLVENNIRLKIIGRRDRIPAKVQAEMDRSLELTRNHTGLVLCLAINYGGRSEIVDAVREIGAKIQEGQLAVEAIDEQTLSDHLYTRDMPDPDLLVRTAGEMRISNYLLWQISYSEIWVTDKLWPEFEIADLHRAMRDYAGRDRRFGGLNTGDSTAGERGTASDPGGQTPPC